MIGGCHCGNLRYKVQGEVITHAICHCNDCRKHAGAPMVAWAMVQENQLSVTKGKAKTYHSSEHGRREFCVDCGTALFYRNALNLPGIVDIQTGTLDDPNALPARCHVQTAERVSWLNDLSKLPEFERYPPQK